MRFSILPLVLSLCALPAFAQQSWFDDFNQPDGNPLPPPWTHIYGTMVTSGNRALVNYCCNVYKEHASVNLPYTQAVATMDFFGHAGATTGTVTAAIGSNGYSDSVACRIQDNLGQDGLFDRVYFWCGAGSSNSNGWGVGSFLPLSPPVLAGRMELYVTNNGDTANLDIDGDFDGVFESHYTLGGILAAGMNLGTHAAIGGYYYASAFDDWKLEQRASQVATYCTAKVNSQGCTPTIYATGIPKATGSASFTIHANHVLNQKPGLLLYSVTGRAASPFQSGFLCVAGPIKRSVPVSSGGSALPAVDCSGVYALDMTAFARGLSGGTPSPALNNPGQVVDVQWWGRDPGFTPPDNSTLSDALEYTVQ